MPFAGDNVPFTGYWHSMCNTTVIRGISRMYQKSRNVTATETGGVSREEYRFFSFGDAMLIE